MSDVLFRLRPLRGVSVTVFDAGFDNRGAVKYRAQVKVGGKVLFPVDGPLNGSFSPMWACDGDEAKEHVLFHLATKPGDTDDDFFNGYTPEQLAFVEANSDEVTMAKLDRYGER